jgi:hypothetical protein
MQLIVGVPIPRRAQHITLYFLLQLFPSRLRQIFIHRDARGPREGPHRTADPSSISRLLLDARRSRLLAVHLLYLCIQCL